jgi:hypothetical protein
MYCILEEPSFWKVWVLLFTMVTAAFLVGGIDLYLRNVTP